VEAIHGEIPLGARLFFLALFFDYLDGVAARLLKSSSKRGEALDRFCDRITQCIVPAITYSVSGSVPEVLTATLLVVAGARRYVLGRDPRFFKGAPLFIPALMIESSALGGFEFPWILLLIAVVMTIIPIKYPRSKETSGGSSLWYLRPLPVLFLILLTDPFVRYVCLAVFAGSVALLIVGPVIWKIWGEGVLKKED